MRTGAKLGAYAVALVVVFGAAAAVGRGVGPVGPPADGSGHTGRHADAAGTAGAAAAGGLAVTQDGYTLALAVRKLPAGRTTSLQFTVLGPDGAPVRRFTPTHEKDLHAIVVRRDLTGFQHVHPTRDATGRWSVPLRLDQPGPYRLFADFTPAGHPRGLVLAAELTVPGAYTPAAPAPVRPTAAVDDYTVTLDGELAAGSTAPVTLTVLRDGRPVTDLEPYLGAYGHLVALRDGDLAYLHVHPHDPPAGRPASGPSSTFAVDVPSAGRYRLFLEFRHRGVVRTAAFSAVAHADRAASSHGH